MKTQGEVSVQVIFLTSALVGVEWSASRPGRFIPGYVASGILCIGGRVGPRAGMNYVEKIKFMTLLNVFIQIANNKRDIIKK
jgi:hypothetical protein